MKTGTTYLQQLLAENRDVLQAQGVLSPPRLLQSRGVRDVMDVQPGAELTRPDGAWEQLREEMLTFQGRAAVVSHEFLSFARKPRAEAIASSLGPAELHVVLTVRDASRVLPSSWATATRNRGTASWQEWTAEALGGPEATGGAKKRRTMRAANVPRMLNTWRRLVAPERLHVVLVPAPGAPPGALWDRFAKVLGVDPDRLDVEPARRGESYGYYSADLMRRINGHLVDLSKPVYHRTVLPLLEVLERRHGEPRTPVTRAVAEWARRWNALTVDAIRSCGANVYGNLSDLEVGTSEIVDAADPPTADQLLPVAADVLSALRRRQGLAAMSPQRWAEASDAVDATVRDIVVALSAPADLTP